MRRGEENDTKEKILSYAMLAAPSCCCCGWMIILMCAFGIHSMGDFARKANAWDDRTAWRQTTCEVLAAGVSCADRDTRSTCRGYKEGAMPPSKPPVFLTEQIAVCPGTYWCAKEGDMCRCNGEITYAPELFDGLVYTVPVAERAYKVVSSGTWKCGTDQNGKPFEIDPAPWHIKHCWCSPQGILDILKQHDASSLHKKECSEAANFDFDQGGARRLRQYFTEDDDALDESDAEDVEDDSSDSEPAKLRRLSHDSRRRRTYTYTPWALVSVPSESTFSSFDSGSDDARQISCAYEFGVPAASAQLYHSDGPYSGDVWKVEDIAKQWGNVSTRPCWVRSRGESGERLAACAVALLKPGSLAIKADKTLSVMWSFLWVTLSLTLCCCGCWVFICLGGASSFPPGSGGAGAQQQGLMSNAN